MDVSICLSESLTQFVHAECLLERHLLAHPPGEENYALAREELRTTHQELLDVSKSEYIKVSAAVKLYDECLLVCRSEAFYG